MDMVPGQPRLIGRGPAATVYSGFRDGAPVAVKVFPARFDRRTLNAFERERRRLDPVAAASPILPVRGVELLPDGRHMLWMELCAQSLAALVRRVGPLTVADTVVLGHELAVALAAAHPAGVVHGGVSPNNALFRASGEPVLADFGVVLRHAFARDPLHTIEFLPPETVRDQTLDERTDLYGLGATLHFALTGQAPHPGRLGEQPGERVLRVLRSPIPAIHRPGVPVELSTLVARMLATDPAHRPRDPSTVAGQLAGMLPHQPASGPPPLPAPTPPRPPLAHPPPATPEPSPPPAPTPPLTHPPPPPPPESSPPPEPCPARQPPAPPQPPDPAPGPDPPDSAEDDRVDEAPQPMPSPDRSAGDGLRPDFGLGTWPPADPPQPGQPHIARRLAIAGGALAVVLVGILLVIMQDRPDELTTTPRTPPAPAPTTPRSAATVQLELAEPTDLGDHVVLTWTAAAPNLDFVVIVAPDGEPNRPLVAGRNRTMRVPVDPGRKYCFRVQATDKLRVYASNVRALHGAVCDR